MPSELPDPLELVEVPEKDLTAACLTILRTARKELRIIRPVPFDLKYSIFMVLQRQTHGMRLKLRVFTFSIFDTLKIISISIPPKPPNEYLPVKPSGRQESITWREINRIYL